MSTKADKKKNKKAPVEETEDAAVEEEVAAPVVEKKKKKKQAEAAEEETPAPTKKGKKKAAAEEEAAEEPAAEEGKKKKKKKAEAAAEEEDAPAPAPEKKKKDKKQPEPAAEAEDDDETPVPTPKGTKRGADGEDASAKKAKTESSGGVCCFLTGLSYSATDDDIAAAWEGVESVDVFKDPEGNSKGRGKVYFDTAEHAQAAIASGGATIAGRFTGIREWTDNGAAGAGGKFGEKRGRDNNGGAWGDKRPRFDDSNAEPSLTVFVRNLSYTATESDIKKAWKGVSEVDLFKDAEGNSKGGGKVTFDTLDNAKKAVENEGTMIAGRQVGVRYWTANAGGDRGGRGGGFGRGRGDRGGFGGRGDRGGRGRFGGRDGGRRGGGRGPSVNSTPAGTKTTFGDDSD